MKHQSKSLNIFLQGTLWGLFGIDWLSIMIWNQLGEFEFDQQSHRKHRKMPKRSTWLQTCWVCVCYLRCHCRRSHTRPECQTCCCCPHSHRTQTSGSSDWSHCRRTWGRRPDMSRPSAADDNELKETNRQHADPGAAADANSLLADSMCTAATVTAAGFYWLLIFNLQIWSFSLGETVSFLCISVWGPRVKDVF